MDNSIPQAEKEKENLLPRKKRSWGKRILKALLILFIVIQFFQPDKNNNDVYSDKSISTVVPVPDTVMHLLKTGCYDCHSNNTNYPWYTNIQPVGWWMKNHITEGKQHLNFDEFEQYEKEKMLDKLKDIKKSQVQSWMPISSYTLMHKNAIFSDAEKQSIIRWADSSITFLSTKK